MSAKDLELLLDLIIASIFLVAWFITKKKAAGRYNSRVLILIATAIMLIAITRAVWRIWR
jgi:hypothetical protein